MAHRVVIIGSGFGGLFAAQALKTADVEVTLVARTAQHLFQPLLYQVATGILSEGEIAPATREILRRQRNVTTLLGLVEDIDVQARTVSSRYHDQSTTTAYDTLIVAAGARDSYFGNDHFATFAPGMKTIDDALEIRARIFGAFEQAELADDPGGADRAAVDRLLTFVVVGAGPTGVEMAGQIRELSSTTLRRDFRRIDPTQARVVLVEGASAVLHTFGDRLSAKALRTLTRLGVEVRLNTMVTDVDDTGIVVRGPDGASERIESICKVWAAGVQGSELATVLADRTGVVLDRSRRVRVEPDLTIAGYPEIFVIGDLMSVDGVPGVAQGAIQGARYAAAAVRSRLAGGSIPGPFRYHDKGSMATVAKFSAVASVGPLRMTGFPAWVAWLVLHLLYIAGFKHRVTTLLHWFISFLSNGRAERAMTNQQLVGRLALEELGSHSSGRLVRGEDPEPH